VVLPRTEQQRESLLRTYPDRHGLHVLEHPVDGLNLLWHSDIVIGGGGTINREAALLGVPVFSIFSGKQGAVDRSLVEQGKLRFLTSVDDVQNIIPQKRRKTARPPGSSQKVIDEILREILNTS
jgi:predicted glycosyltransferase